MTNAPIIEARELHTYYGASHILHGVDFSVRAGESIGLMGRNGMGKTTLIRALVGHVPPRRGDVRINGRVMTNTAPYLIARQGIAYVPEGRGIFPNLTVRENLLLATRVGASGRQDWTLDRVLDTFPRLTERLAHGLESVYARLVRRRQDQIRARPVDRRALVPASVGFFQGINANLDRKK